MRVVHLTLTDEEAKTLSSIVALQRAEYRKHSRRKLGGQDGVCKLVYSVVKTFLEQYKDAIEHEMRMGELRLAQNNLKQYKEHNEALSSVVAVAERARPRRR